jgi:gliding motility-associated-like protein
MLINDVTCNGQQNGNVEALPQGGTSNYSYLWGTGATTQQLNNLSLGKQYVTVTDVNGCIGIDSIMVNMPQSLVTGFTNVDNISCFGNNDGSATVNTTGGVQPYNYSWNNGNIGSIQNNLNAGQYIVTATDGNGCTILDTVNITEPAAMTVTTTIDSIIKCYGDNNGVATIMVTGGTPTYIYLWTNTQPNAQNQNLSAGWQYITVTDLNSCTIIDSILMTEPTQLIANTVTTADSCNRAVGMFSIQNTGGIMPYTYDWGSISAIGSATGGLTPNNYTVTITDDNNCQVTVTDNIQDYCDSCTVFQPINALFDTDFEYTCLGNNLTEVYIDVTGGQPAYNGFGDYIFNFNTNGTPNTTQINSTGAFVFQLQNGDSWNGTVTDNSGCSAFQIGDVFLEDTADCDNYCELYPITISASQDTVIFSGREVELIATTNSTDVVWTPNYNLSCTNCFNTIATPEKTTAYMATAIRDDGCEATDITIVTVLGRNALDSLNSISILFIPTEGPLIIEGVNLYPRNHLYLVNRYGQVVYNKENYSNDWDGRVQGVFLTQDTYYYFLDTNPISNPPVMGSILVIRKE